MRKFDLHFGLVAIVLLLALGQDSLAASARWTVTIEPPRLVNGSPVLFRVTVPKPARTLSGKWLGHDLTFNFDPGSKTWFALAGVSQETKPGSYPLELNGETVAGPALSFEKKIKVALQRYPRIPLTVPSKYTAPSPEDQKEIDKAKEVKAEIFKTVTADREWKGSFSPPVDSAISDGFGIERVFNGTVQSTHQGLDFRAPTGTEVAAVNAGRVILARPLFFEGNCIVIDHGQGLLTLYLHLSKFLVKEGDDVSKGQPIAQSGGTGRATGPHLHLAVRWQGIYLNPQVLLNMKLP